LPKGTYRISQPIVIDLDRVGFTSISGDGVATIVMAGPGPALRFVGTHFKSADPPGFTPNVWQRQRMPCVDGLAIVGEHPEAIGIEAVGTMQLTVTRVHIRGVLHGIHLVQNNRNVLVADSHIYENRGVGIYYDDVNLHQSNITGCHISYCAGGGIVSRRGNVRNIHITGCDLESNMSPDTPATANVLIDCRGSTAGTGEVAITGCTIQHNNPSPDSANIRIIGRSDPSGKLDLVREGNVTITGNVLSDVQVNVHLQDCRGVALTGNTFWQGYKHNLLIEDCSDIIVGPNNFDRNPRYNYGNTRDANNGLVIRNCQDCTLTGLHITGVWRDPAGLWIENCRRFNVTGCTILDCDNAGLVLKNVSQSRVSDCLIRDDRPGTTSAALVVDGGGGNMIVDNLLPGT
jgi:parallel beta-helix repeat protein